VPALVQDLPTPSLSGTTALCLPKIRSNASWGNWLNERDFRAEGRRFPERGSGFRHVRDRRRSLPTLAKSSHIKDIDPAAGVTRRILASVIRWICTLATPAQQVLGQMAVEPTGLADASVLQSPTT
jgi:hypothetical protein